MLKKDCRAWQLAKRLSRRKYCFSRPVALSECGQFVTFESIIRGNQWTHNLASIEVLVKYPVKIESV